MLAQIHSSAVVSDDAQIGEGTQIWLFCQVREGAKVGKDCVLGSGVYVDRDVIIGDRVKIQNNVSVYSGVTLEEGVFVGPHVCFTNDKRPRAVRPNMTVKGPGEWVVTRTLVKAGASIGANSTLVCGVTIGRWAMIGAGSLVSRDVPDHALAVGHPAKVVGWVCSCGVRVEMGPRNERGACSCGRALVRAAGMVRAT